MSTPSIFDYLPEHADTLFKLAEKKAKQESEYSRKLKIIGKNMLATGAGMGAGIAATHGANRLSEVFRGKPIARGTLLSMGPILGGAIPMAYNIHKALEREALEGDLKDQADSGARGIPQQ